MQHFRGQDDGQRAGRYCMQPGHLSPRVCVSEMINVSREKSTKNSLRGVTDKVNNTFLPSSAFSSDNLDVKC